MTDLNQAIENIYISLQNDNADIDQHIAALKTALVAANQKVATFDPGRLQQNNRQGRKLMESYFKKRGVTVEFSKAD